MYRYFTVGSVHKERHTQDRAVGAWCHKEWLLCSIGALARLVLQDLVTNDDEINFLWLNKSLEYPKWQIRPILGPSWSSEKSGYNNLSKAIKARVKYCNIPLNKVTHIRQHNIEYQGFQVSINYFIFLICFYALFLPSCYFTVCF